MTAAKYLISRIENVGGPNSSTAKCLRKNGTLYSCHRSNSSSHPSLQSRGGQESSVMNFGIHMQKGLQLPYVLPMNFDQQKVVVFLG